MARFLLLLSLLLVLFPGAPRARDGDIAAEPLDTGYSERVSVTAARTPIPVDETGNSITILTREDIERRGHVFLADLLRGLPGLSISRSGPAGAQTQIRVRGAEANHVLVRIDGVDVSDAFGADEIPLEILTSFDIERIEFVRGPQSGLWGSDALAGVINILTRSEGTPGGTASVEAGSFGTVQAGGRYGFGNKRLRFDTSVSHLDSDGTNISRQGSERDGTENTTATAHLRYTPSERPFDIDLTARHTDSVSDFDDIDFVTTGLPYDAVNSTNTRLTAVQATGRWQTAGSRASHLATLSSVGTSTRTLLGGAPDTATEIDKLGVSFQTTIDLGRELRHSKHLLSFAVDHEQRDFIQRGTASIFGDPNQDQDIDNTGLVVEYRFSAPDRWALSANVRHERNSDFDNITTFRLTGSVGRQNAKTRFRAAVGSGQKAPTFIERFGFFPNSFIGNPDLHPERSMSFEVGLDRRIGELATFGLTYFNDALEDEIRGFFFDAVAGGFTAVNESAESNRRGLELEFGVAFQQRLDLRGSYTYTDATQPDQLGGTERELRRPEHLASLSAAWRTAGQRFRLNASLHHTGNTADLFFPPFPMPAQRVRLDDYLLANANASFALAARLDLLARVENLLNETYEDVYGFANSGIGAYAGIRFHSGAR
jgi:vitamin B12 transporter